MGEMSTPTTHWRCNWRLNRTSENFLILLPISENSHRIEPPFAQKRAVVFCPHTYLLRIKMPFGRKIRKIIFCSLTNPSGQERVYRPKTFEKYVSHYLATAEGIFCRGNRKNGKKNKPSRRKNLREGCLVLKSSHLRDIILFKVIRNTHGGVIWLLAIKDCSIC